MPVEQIIAMLQRQLEEVWYASTAEPENPDIIMDMGKLTLCVDLLNKICPGWSKETEYEVYAREEIE
jgi:hypothetical protein